MTDRMKAAGRGDRILCLSGSDFTVGQVLESNGSVKAIEGFGRPFRVNRGMAWRLRLNIEGETVRYAYTRPATVEEERSFRERQDAEREAREIDARHGHAVLAVSCAPLVPAGHPPPEGEVLWFRSDPGTLHRHRTILLSADGWLWHLDTDSGDGPRPGANVDPYTIARRLPARDDLVSALRGEAVTPEDDHPTPG